MSPGAGRLSDEERMLFFGGATHDFNEPDGSLRYRATGLEGLYVAVLKLRRYGYELDGHYDGLVDYVRDQVTKYAPGGPDKTALLEIVNGSDPAEKKVEAFVQHMNALQTRICRRLYTHEEAVAIIREAIENGLNGMDRDEALEARHFNYELERWPKFFNERIAQHAGIITGEPNPSITIFDAMPSDYFGIHCALRYGVKVYLCANNLYKEVHKTFLYYLIDKGHLDQGDVDYYYGHANVFDTSNTDIMCHRITHNGDDVEVAIAFMTEMPIGSRLIYRHPHGTKYPADKVTSEHIEVTATDGLGEDETLDPTIFTKHKEILEWKHYAILAMGH